MQLCILMLSKAIRSHYGNCISNKQKLNLSLSRQKHALYPVHLHLKGSCCLPTPPHPDAQWGSFIRPTAKRGLERGFT